MKQASPSRKAQTLDLFAPPPDPAPPPPAPTPYLSEGPPTPYWDYCPNCSAPLQNAGCKYRCTRCHYFMSCSDFD